MYNSVTRRTEDITMKKQWFYRLTALLLAVLLVMPGLALAEDVEIVTEQFEESVADEGELSLDALEPETADAPAEVTEQPAEAEARPEAADAQPEAGEIVLSDAASDEAMKLAEGELTITATTTDTATQATATTDAATQTSTGTDAATQTETTADGTATDGTATDTATDAGDGAPEPQDYTSETPIAANTKLTLYVGDTYQLVMARTAKSYKSSKARIASVTAEGLITAVRPGKATITVTVSKKKKIKIAVTVKDPYAPTAVSVDQSQGKEFYIGMGAHQLSAVLEPAYAITSLKWTSSNRKVAKISAEGLLAPVSAGKTKITVTTANNKKASVTVNIKRNIIDNINAKPTKSELKTARDDGTWTIYPKSLERIADGRYTATFYLVNGLGQSRQISDLGLQLYLNDELIAQKTWSRVKVVSNKGTAKTFKLTFGADDIVNNNPILLSQYGADKLNFVVTTEPNLLYY